MAPAIASILFFCLLLLPHLSNSYHTRYTRGSRQYVVRSTDHAEASTAPATCSSIPSGVSYGKKLPLVHRLSPCSPLNAAGKQSQPSSVDIFRRDARRVRSLLATVRSGSFSDAAAPAPAPTSGVTMPTNGTTVPTAPGVQDYTVLVSYGTPAQQFPVALDTGLGISLLQCKPCLPGISCDPAFDPAQSSTFTHVPCGSPDCRSNCSGSTCPLSLLSFRGAVVRDVITLTPSASVHDFTFGCVESGLSNVRPAVGLLDLSRDSRSLASRLSSSAGGDGTPAFSYCLPLSTSSHGFLSIGANQPQNPGDRVTYAPLVENPALPSYFIELVGMSLGGKDLPILPTAPIANSTILDVVTSFTFLNPAIYTVLRDVFRREMSQYPTAPPFNHLDTCYNFTGLNEIIIPLVGLKFGNGERLVLDGEQMMYFSEPNNPFSVACLGFAAMPVLGSPYSVIGTLAQTSTEVVYDVGGGKVGFIQGSC